LKHNRLRLRPDRLRTNLKRCPFRKIRIEIDITDEYEWNATRDILNRIDRYAKKGM
jgi:hypothetical protein